MAIEPPSEPKRDNALRSLREAVVVDRVLVSGNRQVIRMNHRKMWHFATWEYPYMFGSTDWSFDNNGFPATEP